VIETLTSEQMIPSRTNSPPAEVSTVIETLTTEQMIHHCVDTTAGGLLVLEGIICSVVSVSITVLIPLLVDY
jgi:hypothetical protein